MSQPGQLFLTFARRILDYLTVIKYPAEIPVYPLDLQNPEDGDVMIRNYLSNQELNLIVAGPKNN